MYLARDRFGRLGRKMGEFGDASAPASATPVAVIQPPVCAERTSTVYVNPDQIQADQDYWDSVYQAREDAQAQNDAASQSAQSIADDVWYKQAKELDSFQNNIPENADDATIKNYLANCVGTSEAMRVANSISPNFNINRLAPGSVFQTPTWNPDSDFNQFQLMGNPLTRDGQYGVVTDWDRFLQGQELTGAEVQDPSAMNGNNSTILYKNPSSFARHPMGYMGDDGDDGSDDSAPAAYDPSTDPYAALPSVAPTASASSSSSSTPAASSSSDINWTSVLTTGLSSAGSVLTAAEKAAGIKPAGSTTVVAAPSAVTGSGSSILMYGLIGVVALGLGIFIYKKVSAPKTA